MRNLKYDLLAQLRYKFDDSELSMERFEKISNTFDYKGTSDDFITIFKIFLAMFPMSTKMRNVYNKMETDSQRIGYLTKHLIKVGNNTDEVASHLVDEFIKVKKQYDYWADYYKREMEEIKYRLDNLSSGDPNIINKVFEYGQRQGEYAEKYRDIKQRRNRATYKLIKYVCHNWN